jgi:ParB family chromosome partitioning protein
VKETDDKNSLVLSIIENIQREDLNPIEEAEAFQTLIELHDYTQEEIGKQVGKSRTSITNYLRLLKLNKKIKEDLLQNKITMGHARAYLGLDSSAQQFEVHSQVLRRNLSVRQTENLIQRLKKGIKITPPNKSTEQQEFLVTELRKRLGTKVSLNQRGKKGKLIIEFYSQDELEKIFNIITGRER